MDRLISLGEALAHSESAHGDEALFLPMNVAWGTATSCAILAVDQYDESEPDPPFAREHRLAKALRMDQVEDIVANAKEQIGDPSPEQMVAALLHYYERDAFIDFEANRQP